MNLGAPELVIILLVMLLLFGGAKLPKLARSLGEAHQELKKGMEQVKKEAASAPPVPAPTEGSVTLTKSEYEALLAAKHDVAPDQPPSSGNEV